MLGSALDVIVESVATGDRVSLVGFGTFDSKERAAREGRNPQTGEKMQLAGARATPRRRLTRRCHHRAHHLRRLRTAGPTATGNSAYRCIPATSYAQSTRHDRNPPLTTPDGNGANRVIHTRVALTPVRRPARAATMVPTFSFGKGFKDAVKAEYNANK